MDQHVRVAGGRLGLRHRALDAVGHVVDPLRHRLGRRAPRGDEDRDAVVVAVPPDRRSRRSSGRRRPHPSPSPRRTPARSPPAGRSRRATRRSVRRATRAAARRPTPSPCPAPSSGPGDEPVERHRHVQDGLAPCGLLPRGLDIGPSQPVERVRHTAAVLVAQRRRTGSPHWMHRHQRRPVSGRERELGAEGERRPVEAGLGRGQQQSGADARSPRRRGGAGRARPARDRTRSPRRRRRAARSATRRPSPARRCRRTRAGPPGS